MREEWVSWFGIPTQFSPHWAAGMAIAEPTAQTPPHPERRVTRACALGA